MKLLLTFAVVLVTSLSVYAAEKVEEKKESNLSKGLNLGQRDFQSFIHRKLGKVSNDKKAEQKSDEKTEDKK